MWPGGVTQQPPRSTYWFTMNLPLYSPTAPGRGPEPRDRGCRSSTSTATRRRRASRPAADGRGCSVPRSRKFPSGAWRGGDGLPLGLGGQPGAGPTGEGVGLVVADVAHGLGGVDQLWTGQGEQPPVVDHLEPVQRGVPPVGLGGGPPVGQPQVGPPVSAVVHEFQPLPAGDEAVGQGERLEVHGVARELVVEAEPVTAVPDVDQAAGVWRSTPVGGAARRGVHRAPWRRPAAAGCRTGRA